MAQEVFRLRRAVPAALALLALAGCGPRRIPFRIIARGSSPVRYIVLHGNETTAKAVVERHMAAHPGVAFVIASQTRNIRIAGGLIDPNRMFSEEGAERSLRRLNPGWDDARIKSALPDVRSARDKLLADLLPPPGGLIVALHNNTTTTLIEGEIKISSRTSLRDPASPHEFMIATDPGDFEKLAKLPYNVLLEDRPPPPDDGSLSRLAAARGVRYVNIEAGLDAFDKQRQMLEALLNCCGAAKTGTDSHPKRMVSVPVLAYTGIGTCSTISIPNASSPTTRRGWLVSSRIVCRPRSDRIWAPMPLSY